MKNLLLLMAILPLMCTATPRADLKLMSFNIRYYNTADSAELSWQTRRDGIFRMIRRENPDVIGMQEVRIEQLNDLDTMLTGYNHIECGRDFGAVKGGNPGEQMVILYRADRYTLLDSGHFWLSPTPDKVSKGWDAACRRIAVWAKLRDDRSGKVFYYFDTHFDHIGAKARMHSAKLIVDKIATIAGSAPAFVSGDLNEERGSQLINYMDSHLTSAREDAEDTDDKYTFNAFGSTQYPHMKIDYIYFQGAKTLKYKTFDRNYGVDYISDHYPIMGWFRFE